MQRLLKSAEKDQIGVKNVLSITTVVEDSGPPTGTIANSGRTKKLHPQAHH